MQYKKIIRIILKFGAQGILVANGLNLFTWQWWLLMVCIWADEFLLVEEYLK